MRRLSIAALMAVPLLLVIPLERVAANPNPPRSGFGCGDFCLGLFKNIHQHGPLYNYGPYYGYYPFTPYGPWDPYLRYDPFFYGDPSANWQGRGHGHGRGEGNYYGRNPHLPQLLGHGFGHAHSHGCASCGFNHASWLHGGWFRGHEWLHGGLFHKPACSSCGGVAQVGPVQPTGDVLARYSGVGSADQSAVFYAATPTLNPALELVPVAGQSK